MKLSSAMIATLATAAAFLPRVAATNGLGNARSCSGLRFKTCRLEKRVVKSPCPIEWTVGTEAAKPDVEAGR